MTRTIECDACIDGNVFDDEGDFVHECGYCHGTGRVPIPDHKLSDLFAGNPKPENEEVF